jgi:hypothetical protein
MRDYYRILHIIGFVLLLAVSACQAGTQKNGESEALLGDFPPGIFQNLAMNWTLEFYADGTYYGIGVFVSERGAFTVTGDQITMQGDHCGEIKGTYTWTYDGEVLNFSVLDDECMDRRVVIDQGSWVLTP